MNDTIMKLPIIDEPTILTSAHPGGPVIDLSQCQALTKHKPHALEKLLSIMLESFIAYKAEFRALIMKRNSEALGQLIHKSKMGITLVAARQLDMAISSGRTLIDEGARDAGVVEEATQRIEMEFDKVIAAFRQFIN